MKGDFFDEVPKSHPTYKETRGDLHKTNEFKYIIKYIDKCISDNEKVKHSIFKLNSRKRYLFNFSSYVIHCDDIFQDYYKLLVYIPRSGLVEEDRPIRDISLPFDDYDEIIKLQHLLLKKHEEYHIDVRVASRVIVGEYRRVNVLEIEFVEKNKTDNGWSFRHSLLSNHPTGTCVAHKRTCNCGKDYIYPNTRWDKYIEIHRRNFIDEKDSISEYKCCTHYPTKDNSMEATLTRIYLASTDN